MRRKFFRQAERLLLHPEELRALLGRGLKKAYARRGTLLVVFDEFLVLFRMVKAWVTGEYRETPRKVILWAVLAILYFLSPLDFFPDLFPGGYFDDVAFITFVVGRIKGDLLRFREWEAKKK